MNGKMIRSLVDDSLGVIAPVSSRVHDRLHAFIRAHKNESYAPFLLISPYLFYMVIFFLIPMAYILFVSFFTNIEVGTLEPALTLENYVEFLTSGFYREILYTTVEISLLSTLFTIVISYPIAYFIVFSEWAYSKVLILLVIAPMLVGNVVRAFGWFAIMGSSGVATQLLGYLGFSIDSLIGTKIGLVVAISSVLMPFAILILMSVLYTIDQDIIEAAYNLGANRLQAFLYITFPLSLPGVIGATLISFVLTMGTFATDVFIGMPQIPMIGPFIYRVSVDDLNWPLAAAMAFVLLAVSFIFVYVYKYLMDLQESKRTRTSFRQADEEGIGLDRSFRLSRVLDWFSLDYSLFGLSLVDALWALLLLSTFLFLLLPVLFAVLISFNPSELYTFPPETITLDWYAQILESSGWIQSFRVSFEISILATVIATALSTSAAYAIGRFDFPFRDVLSAGTFLPLMIPQIILGLALLIFLNNFGLVGNLYGLAIGLAVYATPFATQSILATIENYDRSIEEAAMNLGANEIETFRYVTFPILLPGILTAAILSFIISYSNLQIAVFLQGPSLTPIPVRIFSEMQFGASPIIAAVSTVNIVLVLLAMTAVERLFGAAEALGYV